MLLQSIRYSLDELIVLLDQLTDEDYVKACEALSNATIGQHVRHILEMFKCLEEGYDSGVINYDNRERNHRIQSETEFAKLFVTEIKKGLKTQNKVIFLDQLVNGLSIRIQSNYYRELLYNMEHCVHHQALIKVAVLPLKAVVIAENFGVARSTIA